jgi:predicted protein tyrosine phosphatase
VAAALEAIRTGEAVLAYCLEGRHRSVAMACAIMVARGRTADQAMAQAKLTRPAADPYAPHVAFAIRRFEASWKDRRPPTP